MTQMKRRWIKIPESKPPIKPSPEHGEQAAEILAAFHARLIRKGLSPEAALEIAGRVSSAASSYGDGHCGDLARRMLDVVLEP